MEVTDDLPPTETPSEALDQERGADRIARGAIHFSYLSEEHSTRKWLGFHGILSEGMTEMVEGLMHVLAERRESA